MRIKIDTKALHRWAGKTRRKGERIAPAMVSSLNYVGEKTVAAITRQVSAQTGMPEEVVRRHITIRPATRGRPRYEIDATEALVRAPATRPMPRKGRRRQEFPERDDTVFKQGELVDIVDMGDDKVCEVCEELAANGPYSIEEARGLIPAHPNCRCVVNFREGRRQVPRSRSPQFRASSTSTPQETMGELLGRMREEMRSALRG